MPTVKARAESNAVGVITLPPFLLLVGIVPANLEKTQVGSEHREVPFGRVSLSKRAA